MRGLLDLMVNPQATYPVVHVAGSNGKTSTARMITFVLAAHGVLVGTFTSPHLERVEERLALNGDYAEPAEFAAAVTDVAPFVDLFEERGGMRPTYFELTTATALAWFAERAVDAAVVEVGLGGRLDATNVVDGTVAVLTGVTLEHTDYLGDSLLEIAREKLAIAKPGGVLVTGPLPPEVEEEAERHAESVGIVHRHFGRDFALSGARMALGGWVCDVKGIYGAYDSLHLRLHGRHQTENLAVAVAAVEEFFGRALSIGATQEGVAAVTSPGRLEVLGHQPLLVIDGAHNEEGFEALATAVAEEFPPLRWTLVLGVMRDKPLERMLLSLRGRLARVVATSVGTERAAPPTDVAAATRRVLGPEVEVEAVDGVAAAVRRALELTPSDGALLVAGSLYVAGEARSVLQDGPVPPRAEGHQDG